jgi:hypothetical protein
MQSLRSLPLPSVSNSHRHDGINTPRPAFVLNADRSDFDLLAVVFEDHAVIVVSLWVDISPSPDYSADRRGREAATFAPEWPHAEIRSCVSRLRTASRMPFQLPRE